MPSNMTYFGSSHEGDDLDSDDECEEEELDPCVASVSCQSTPRKGKLPGKLNGHGESYTPAPPHTVNQSINQSINQFVYLIKRDSVHS